MTEQLDTVIVGGGQAGLATSYCLTQNDHEHAVLEKQRIGEAWRSGKWDSFTLVTPNYMLQLPGAAYTGPEPEGFLTRDKIIHYLENYADRFDLPVRTGVEVTALDLNSDTGFKLETSDGSVSASNVVIATGTFQQPNVPAFSSKLPPDLFQIHSMAYRNPDQLPPGAVLVVGSAQSGCQIAEELNAHGRDVYLSTGKADRLPRRYRGKDSFWWAEQLGLFDQTVEHLPSLDARFNPNPQVSGTDGGHTLSLHHLARDGVTLLGRMTDADGTQATFADDLIDHVAQADEFAAKFKQGVDKLVAKSGMDMPEDDQPELRDAYDTETIAQLDLEDAGIRSIIWATGYRFDYSWIPFAVVDDAGYPVHQRGISEQPGLYFVGLHWLHTRKSGLLLGVGEDAKHVATHITKRSEEHTMSS